MRGHRSGGAIESQRASSAPTFTLGALLARRGEQRAPQQAGQADEQHVRELLHPHVVQVDCSVVVLAAVRDLLLQPGDAPLQLEVGGACLQVRIGFGRGEQPADAMRQLLLGGQTLGVGTAAAGARAQRGDFLNQLSLVTGVTLHDVDQLRQLLVPLLEQDVDVRPRLVDLVLDADERVVERDAVGHDRDCEQQQREHGHGDPDHEEPPSAKTWMTS